VVTFPTISQAQAGKVYRSKISVLPLFTPPPTTYENNIYAQLKKITLLTDRWTDRQTSTPIQLHNLLGGGNNKAVVMYCC